MIELELTIDIAADADTVFAGVTDWTAQREWMLGTDVVPVFGDGVGKGARLEAWTGIGRVGFLDTMTVTEWDDAARSVTVLHTGKVVRGGGEMSVVALGPDRSRFVWSEWLELPLGVVGRLGWPVVRPVFVTGVRQSLRAFAELAESGRWEVPRRDTLARPGSG